MLYHGFSFVWQRMALDLMKPLWRFRLAFLALAIALTQTAAALAQDANSALFKKDIQRFTDELARNSGGAVKWAGSDAYQIQKEGKALVAVIHHARLAVKAHYLNGEIALGTITIRRTLEAGGKTIDLAASLPGEITFRGPGPTGPTVLGKIALKGAKVDVVIDEKSGFTQASSLSAAGGRLDLPTTGSWLTFGSLSMKSNILAEANGGWSGPSGFELKEIKFVTPLGAVGGTIDRIAYVGKSGGPNLAAFEKLRAALSQYRAKAVDARKADLPALLAALQTLPQALGSMGADFAVEGIAVRSAGGEAMASLKKAEFAVNLAGLDGKTTSLRFTLGENGLSVSPALAHGSPVPRRIAIDFGLENLNNAALREIIDSAASSLNGHGVKEGMAKERQQLLASAAKLTPVFRVYDVSFETQKVGLDLTGKISGSPLAANGYTAAADLVVRGFEAIGSLHPGPRISEYLPLLQTIAVVAKAADGTPRLRFHLASSMEKWVTINGNDVGAWFFAPAQKPGEPRLLRLAYPALKGADVKRVQQALAANKIAVSVSGAYDGATAAAVARFQKAKGLNVDGVVDAATRKKLGIQEASGGATPSLGHH